MKRAAGYRYPDCRDMRHGWVHADDTVLAQTQGEVKLFTRTLVCFRCETKRIDTYRVASRGGHAVIKVGVKYDYPRDYQVKGGFDVDRLRWDLFQRAKVREDVS